jgi:hypothetical protein
MRRRDRELDFGHRKSVVENPEPAGPDPRQRLIEISDSRFPMADFKISGLAIARETAPEFHLIRERLCR